MRRFPLFYQKIGLADIQCKNVTCEYVDCIAQDKTDYNLTLLNKELDKFTYSMHVFVAVKVRRKSNICNDLLKNMCNQQQDNYDCMTVGKSGVTTWFYYKPKLQVASTRQNTQTIEEQNKSERELRPRKRQAGSPAENVPTPSPRGARARRRLGGGDGSGKTSLARALSTFSGSTPGKIEAVWRHATRRGLIDDAHSVRQLTHLLACVFRRNIALVHFVDHDDGKADRVTRTVQSVTYFTVPELSTTAPYGVLYAITTETMSEETPPTFKVLLEKGAGGVSFFFKDQLESLIDKYEGPKKRRVSLPPSACANVTKLARYATFLLRPSEQQ